MRSLSLYAIQEDGMPSVSAPIQFVELSASTALKGLVSSYSLLTPDDVSRCCSLESCDLSSVRRQPSEDLPGTCYFIACNRRAIGISNKSNHD